MSLLSHFREIQVLLAHRLIFLVDLMDYLLAQSNKFDYRAYILIDSKLADSLFGKPQQHKTVQIRVYDLDDPRAAIIRNEIKGLPAEAHFMLLRLLGIEARAGYVFSFWGSCLSRLQWKHFASDR